MEKSHRERRSQGRSRRHRRGRSRSSSSSRAPSRKKQHRSYRKSNGIGGRNSDAERSLEHKEKKRARGGEREAKASRRTIDATTSSEERSRKTGRRNSNTERSPEHKEKKQARGGEREAKPSRRTIDATTSSEERSRKQKDGSSAKDGERSQRPLAEKNSHDSKGESERSATKSSKDSNTPQDSTATNPENLKSSKSTNSKLDDGGRSQTEAGNAVKGQASGALKAVVDIAALKKRLEEDRNKLSILKDYHEWQQHKEAESSPEIRDKEFYQGAAGDVIGPSGKFKVEEKIGLGHFANVFRCKDVQNGEEYAVKILRASGVVRKAAEEEAKLCRWVHEEARRKNLDSIENIVSLVGPETFDHAGHFCLVFSLLKSDLRCMCEKINKGKGLPASSLQRYGANLFSALKLLHKLGVVHTDIKPDNLLVSRAKDRRGLDYVQLIDFGSAKKLDKGNGIAPEGITFSGYVSPRFYRAPEVFLGQSYDTQVDIWGAGATLFEMATAKILFEGSSTSNAMIHSILRLSGQFSVMFSSRGKHCMRHFNRNGDFLLVQDDKSTRRIPMSEFARPQHLIVDDLEKHMGFGKADGPPEVLLRRLSDVIENCLAVDPIHRSTAEGALELDFFKKGSRR